MRAAFADISVPLIPLEFIRAQHFFVVNSKGVYHIASIFDMQINLKKRG